VKRECKGSFEQDFEHYCLTDLTVDSNDITVLVSGEQKHYFHNCEDSKNLSWPSPLVIFSVPTHENNAFYAPSTARNTTDWESATKMR
jgi:hypothetical protein